MQADPLRRRFENILSHHQNLLVAVSGGVDSALVLHVAASVLGPEHVLAAIAVSPIYKAEALERASAAAERASVPLLTVETRELELPAFRTNDAQRCFVCRANLYRHLRRAAERHGLETIADGTQLDDLGAGDRPGLRAALAFGIQHPLAEAGFDKAAVRLLARHLGLPEADLPADACLATRIPRGEAIAASALERVNRAEASLTGLVCGRLRVRDHGALARVEVETDALAAVLALRHVLLERLQAAGYRHVTLDLAGYRPEGMADD